MSGAMLLVASGIFGGFFYLQKQAGSADSAALPTTLEEAIRADAVKRGMIYDSKNHSVRYPDLTLDEQEAFVSKLKLIREKWRPWAQSNQATLKKMLRAQADDEATLMSVYQALPSSAEERGIPNRDLLPINDMKEIEGLMKDRTPIFTWNMTGKRAVIPEKMRTQHEKSQRNKIKSFRKDFAQMRDIPISQSIARSDPLFSLWASGRITKSNRVYLQRSKVQNGQKVMGSTSQQGPHEEVVPPFEFLQ